MDHSEQQKGRGFPRYSLPEVESMLKRAAQTGERTWTRDQFAQFSADHGKSTKSGVFKAKLAALRYYDLAWIDRSLIALNADGVALLEQPENKQIRQKILSGVETFKELVNAMQPGETYTAEQLTHLALSRIGISSVSTSAFFKSFFHSAKQADLLEQTGAFYKVKQPLNENEAETSQTFQETYTGYTVERVPGSYDYRIIIHLEQITHERLRDVTSHINNVFASSPSC